MRTRVHVCEYWKCCFPVQLSLIVLVPIIIVGNIFNTEKNM